MEPYRFYKLLIYKTCRNTGMSDHIIKRKITPVHGMKWIYA